MGALLDVISIVILIWCVWSAARRGFVKTLIGFVGTLIALVLAVTWGPAAASVIKVRFVGPFFENTVGEYLMTYMSGRLCRAVQQAALRYAAGARDLFGTLFGQPRAGEAEL